ncbi:MAG: hypothetical protein Q4D60_12030 [Eubacteriales bacterium]|nr:hypothetical protein [Eubacteriales bacterium]
MISQRAYRMAIVPYAAILVFGCFIGLYFRRDQEIRVLLPWSIGSGLSLAFFWFIREDSIWIMPFVAVVLLLLIVQLFLYRKNIKKIVLRLVLYFLPILVLVTADLTQRAINYSHYGIFSTNDRSDTEFGKMMSYLYKIEDKQAADDVWVSNQTIEKVMSVSPTFASIRTEITDSLAAWMGGQDACGDVILWALRDAATWAGYYEDAVTANQFWGKVNDEIKEAIENGSLKTDHLIRFSSMSKGTTWSKIPFFIKKTLKGMFSVGMYKDTGLSYDNKSAGEMEDIRKFEALLGSFGNYPQISDSISTYTQNAIKVGNSIVGVFKGLAPFSFVLAILGYLIATVHILRHLVKMHKFDGMIDMWLVITALLLSSLVLTFGVMFFCSWFPPRMSVYLNFYNAGSYALLQIAKYLAIYCGVKLTVNYLKKSKPFRPLEG